MPRSAVWLLLSVLVVLVGCENRSSESADSGAADPATSAKKTDQLATEDLAKSKIAAKSWLMDTNHGTFKATKADIIKFTDDSLAAGAVGVWVSGPEELEGKQLIDHLFIELPTDAAKRAKLFDLYNKRSEDAEKDVGQKFLALDWG